MGKMNLPRKGHLYFYSKTLSGRQLSNFYICHIDIDGKRYLTTEHYYQSKKAINPEEEEEIRKTSTPFMAKRLGSHCELRPDWEDVKEMVMLTGLRVKFRKPHLRKVLLLTGTVQLHEFSPNDMYWGYKGRDRLGILLMQVRDELRKERVKKIRKAG